MHVGHMRHQLRGTKPTIGHHQRCREVEAAAAEGRQALIEHALSPTELGAATPPWPFGVGPTPRKVDGHHQLAVANDHQEEHAINAADHALVLTTPPLADALELTTIFSKDRVIQNPAPLPTAPGGLAHRLDVAPKRPEDIVAELAQPFEPRAFRQSAQHARGQIFVPAAGAGQLIGIDAAKECGKHEAEDFAEPLLLGSQAAFDLGNEVVRQAEIVEGLVEGFDIALGLSLLVLVALLPPTAVAVIVEQIAQAWNEREETQ